MNAIERVVEKPVIVEKVVEKVVEKPVEKVVEKVVDKVVEKTTLLYICIGIAILMTISAISATVSCMKWESKYSTLVDRLLHTLNSS